jgi:hypothetical protein
METVVADTCALVSLAIPKADTTYDAVAYPDPFQYLLTSCRVTIPTRVQADLREMAQYEDVQGTAAANVLAAANHFRTVDTLGHEDTPAAIPDHGLDDGEMAGIVLANALEVDGFLTDELTNLARIRALLDGSTTLVPTPRLLRDYVRAGHLTPGQATDLFDIIAPHRSWDENAYLQSVRRTL